MQNATSPNKRPFKRRVRKTVKSSVPMSAGRSEGAANIVFGEGLSIKQL